MIREQLLEKELKNIEDSFPYKDTPPVTWINVDGLHDLDIIDKIGRHFGIHPLTLEDIVNTGHRPKAEDFEDYEYIVLKMLTYDEDQNHITAEQVSFILGPRYLISFQETEGDVFNFVRERHSQGKRADPQVGLRLPGLCPDRCHRGSLFPGARKNGGKNRTAGRRPAQRYSGRNPAERPPFEKRDDFFSQTGLAA